MRIKTFFIALLCGVVFFFTLIFFKAYDRPSFQSLVSVTHDQIYSLKNFKENLQNAKEKKLEADEKHLLLLGFTDTPRLYPKNCWTNTTLPVIVTTVFTGEGRMGISFAKNIAHMASNHAVLMYIIGLSPSEFQSLSTHCNTSQCQIVPFDISVFPSHVQNDPVRTVKPLVIQDALNKAGGIFYLDNKFRIVNYIDPLIETKPIGSFVTKQAVTTLTHPNMMNYFRVFNVFDYKPEEVGRRVEETDCEIILEKETEFHLGLNLHFRTSVDSFLFLPMVETNRLLLWNTIEVHKQVMLPWIQCILTFECVHPIGAQSQGCRFNKKPRYRYSGCHAYDSSALNVVLGLTYHFDSTNYTFPLQDTFFVLSSTRDNATVS